MKERDTLEGIKNRYRRQIEELRLKRNEIDLELANLESYASTLQEIQACEDSSGSPEHVAAALRCYHLLFARAAVSRSLGIRKLSRAP